jgi:hypothetical protein
MMLLKFTGIERAKAEAAAWSCQWQSNAQRAAAAAAAAI